MNRRSFISKIVQGGTVVATGLPEKLLSSEASTVAVDKIPIEVERRLCDSITHYWCGCPLDIQNGMRKLELDYNAVHVGNQTFVHKKYFLVALLIMNTESKKI